MLIGNPRWSSPQDIFQHTKDHKKKKIFQKLQAKLNQNVHESYLLIAPYSLYFHFSYGPENFRWTQNRL